MKLTEFLLARIAEDEALAQVATPGQWDRDSGWSITAPPPEDWSGPYVVVETKQRNDAEFIASHNPARVLAECEAKRNIVAHLVDAERGVARAARLLAREGNDSRDAQEAEFAADAKLDAVTCIAKHVAAVYADHPDFDEEWRP